MYCGVDDTLFIFMLNTHNIGNTATGSASMALPVSAQHAKACTPCTKVNRQMYEDSHCIMMYAYCVHMQIGGHMDGQLADPLSINLSTTSEASKLLKPVSELEAYISSQSTNKVSLHGQLTDVCACNAPFSCSTYLIMMQKSCRLMHFVLSYSTIDSSCMSPPSSRCHCYPHSIQITLANRVACCLQYTSFSQQSCLYPCSPISLLASIAMMLPHFMSCVLCVELANVQGHAC